MERWRTWWLTGVFVFFEGGGAKRSIKCFRGMWPVPSQDNRIQELPNFLKNTFTNPLAPIHNNTSILTRVIVMVM